LTSVSGGRKWLATGETIDVSRVVVVKWLTVGNWEWRFDWWIFGEARNEKFSNKSIKHFLSKQRQPTSYYKYRDENISNP